MKNYIKSLSPPELLTAVHIIVVLFGLPLAFHHAYADIGITKYYVYCGATAILAPALVLKLIKDHSILSFFKSLTTAEKALLVYWAVSGLSTLFSPYRFEAFWGNEGRLCGLFLMSLYVISYFVITRCYKPHSVYLKACLLSGSIVFIFAITDFFGLNLLRFKDNIDPVHAPIFISTIGNINFYAGYGAVILGLAAGLYTTWPERKGSAIRFFFMVLAFIGLIIGNSDNAYLTFGVLLAFLPLYLFQTRRGIRRYLMMVSALLFSFMTVKMCDIFFSDLVLAPDGLLKVIDRWDGFNYICFAVWIITGAVYYFDYKRNRQDDRMGGAIRVMWLILLGAIVVALVDILIDANLLSHGDRYGSLSNYIVFNNDWGTHRGYIWRTAIENYKNFPITQKILGHGPDTYGIVSLFNNLQESAALYGELYDSVHNEYLQFFVTIGPIGTAAYIAFLALSVRDMIKCRCGNYVVGITFAVLCYCGQALVNINQPASASIMWTLLAMGIAECRRAGWKTPGTDQIPKKGRRRP